MFVCKLMKQDYVVLFNNKNFFFKQLILLIITKFDLVH